MRNDDCIPHTEYPEFKRSDRPDTCAACVHYDKPGCIPGCKKWSRLQVYKRAKLAEESFEEMITKKKA